MEKKKIMEMHRKIVSEIKDYFKRNKIKNAVVGLSGGLDSSVTAYLTVKAIGSKNVLGILMPDKITSKRSNEDAKLVAKKLRISYKTIAINDFVNIFENLNKKLNLKKNLFAIGNVKARARMTILYYFANLNNALVVGTSDKSEIVLGYATKYGDNASDIMPIADIWKTELKELGKFIGVPESVLSKKSSPELVEGITAETELGEDYDILDIILKHYVEKGLSANEITKKGFKKNLVLNSIDRIEKYRHKRTPAKIIKVSKGSFHDKNF